MLKGEVEALERARLAEALRQSGGVITRAAAALGLSPQLMGYKMKKHGLRREDFT